MEVQIRCLDCRAKLEARPVWVDGKAVIWIEPCKKCCDQHYQAGHADGLAEGEML